MQKQIFPFTVYTWRNNFPLANLDGLDYMGEPFFFLMLLILPVFIIYFIVRTIFVFKYIFKKEAIIRYSLLGFKKIIKPEMIYKIIDISGPRSCAVQVIWKKNRSSMTRRITINSSFIEKLEVTADDMKEILNLNYT